MKEKDNNDKGKYEEEGENGEDDNVELDEDSGLKNYFKEIVKNANKYGEKLDLSKYQHLIKEYESVSNKRGEGGSKLMDLEKDTRVGLIGGKR